jgi:hypothetical protein
MDACPLLITSTVAVKPEDQGTFFQDFLGLSGYLCSIGGCYPNTALLRTRNAQNHNEAQLRFACAKSNCFWKVVFLQTISQINLGISLQGCNRSCKSISTTDSGEGGENSAVLYCMFLSKIEAYCWA